MTGSHTGEIAALITAILWTCTALAFEVASKKVGSLVINLIRLSLALLFYTVFLWIRDGNPFPSEINQHGWFWLSVSGLIGFIFGDYCLIKAYSLIGSRVANLLMALAPPLTALFGFLIINEYLSIKQGAGMLTTLAGIVMVILYRSGKIFRLHYSMKGILYGIGGAVGQAIGLVFSKYGMQQADPFSASQVRVIAGVCGYLILFTLLNKWDKLLSAVRHWSSFKLIAIGSFFGPFLGVSFSLLAIKYTSTAIASTFMAMVPVLIIAPAAVLFHEKIKWKDVMGALIAVGGIVLLFFWT